MTSKMKILLVDDEEDVLEFLEYILKKEGFEVEMAKNGLEGIHKAKKFEPNLILLDRMMPEMNGIEACRELRTIKEFDNTKIVFLTASGDTDMQIEGLEIGADDYLVKPVKSKLLISKIKSIMRMNAAGLHRTSIIQYKHITIDLSKYEVLVHDKVLIFPRKEFQLLSLLMSEPGKVFRREEILETIWGKEIFVGDRTIDVHIRKLREKLGDDCFSTVKGIGYKFVPF